MWDNDLTFGVELEFATEERFRRTNSSLSSFMYSASYPFNNAIQHGFVEPASECWQLKYDGSCGMELTSPILRRTSVRALGNVCKFLQEQGVRATSSCGLHVHHGGLRYRSIEHAGRMAAIWAYFEPALLNLVHPRRARNGYAFPIRGTCRNYVPRIHQTILRGLRNRDQYIRSASEQVLGDYVLGGRYHSLNLSGWRYGRTIEVRMMDGTLNYTRILPWIHLTQRLLVVASRERELPEFVRSRNWPRTTNIETYRKQLREFTGLRSLPSSYTAERA